MIWNTKKFGLLLFIVGLKLANTCSAANLGPTHQMLDWHDDDRQRPVKVHFWYPQGKCAVTANSLCLADNIDPSKIAVISHGAMGSALGHNWLGYALASQGWIAVGISHYGESWEYGRETIDPINTARFWHRPEDVSFVLNHLEKAHPFQVAVDTNNVTAIGFSSGGHTAAALAGVTVNMELLADYCTSSNAQDDLGCSYKPDQKRVDVLNWDKFDDSYRDPRIKSAVLLDPGFGPGATTASMEKVNIPTLIFSVKNSDFLISKFHGERYAKHIQGSQLLTLNNGEGHFVFLDSCNHEYKARGVSLCTDREGVDRKAVQRQVLGSIFSFLGKNH